MYPEYDPNEQSLGQSWADILRGFKNPQSWQEVGQGIQNTAQIIPNVVESLGRGGVAQAVGTMGDLRDLRNTVQSYLPKSIQNFSNAAEFLTNPYAKALTQTAPTTEQTLETVPRITAPYEGSKTHETVGEYIAPALGYFGAKALKAGKDLPIGLTMQDVGPIIEPTKVADALRQPDKNALGFYSPLDEAVINLQNQKGTGQQYLAQLLKTGGVKPEEVATRGLDTFLTENPKVTKPQIEEFLANNPVQLKETTLAEPKNEWSGNFLMIDRMGVAKIEENAEGMYVLRDTMTNKVTPLDVSQLDQAVKKAEEIYGVSGEVTPYGGKPKFADYTLPNGENYREVLLQTPTREEGAYVYASNPDKIYGKVEEQGNGNYKVIWNDGTGISGGYNKESAEAVAKAGKTGDGQGTVIKKFPSYQEAFDYAQSRPQEERLANHIRPANTNPDYKSGHFDQPNILAHMRVTDRTIDGKKTLFVEEIQSDWHQKGRQTGYQNKSGKYGEKVTDEEYKRGVQLQNQQRNQTEPLTPAEQAEFDDIMGRHQASIAGNKVPDAPFKKNWQELAMKRAMQMAAEGGYDRVAFTTGKQQNARYSLSNFVNKVAYEKGDNGLYDVYANNRDGKEIISKEDITLDEIEETFGKEMAKKISEDQGKAGDGTGYRNWKTFTGVDLEVGGEGMKGFYDKILPDFINKYGKKHGLKVGQTNLKRRGVPDASLVYETAQKYGYSKQEFDRLPLDEQKKIRNESMPKGEEVHYFDLTPEAKESFLKKGQPMFAVAPIGLTDEDTRREVLEKLFNKQK